MKTYFCSHLVTLQSGDRRTAANLEKISAQLATVNAEEELPVGAAVKIACGSAELEGFIVSCEIDALGYFVEVRLNEAWSIDRFRPEHLFDPEGV